MMKKYILFILLMFFAFNLKVNAADQIKYNYICYNNNSVLKNSSNNYTSTGSWYGNGFDISYQCPSGWTNVNFTFELNVEQLYIAQYKNVYYTWYSSVGSSNKRYDSNFSTCSLSTNIGADNICVSYATATNQFRLNLFGNGGSNTQLLRDFRYADDNYRNILNSYIQNSNINDSVINNNNSNADKIVDNNNSNTDKIIDNQNNHAQWQAQQNEQHHQEEMQKEQEQTDAINGINDSITSPDVNTDSASGFFGDFKNDDHGLSSVITTPLNFIKNISTKACEPVPLTIPFVNESYEMPCMSSIYEKAGQSIKTTYQRIMFGIISYYICIQFYAMVKGFKDPQNDKIEVVDL